MSYSNTAPPAITKPWPLSYWMPGKPGALTDFNSSSALPSEADVVIIGSGFSGASTAYHLLCELKNPPKRVVMVESRQACSGASGRNGGHLQPTFFPGPPYGSSQVKRGQFERQNYEALQELIRDNCITGANTTFTDDDSKGSEGWLVYPTKVAFDKACLRLSKLNESGGDSSGIRVYFGNEARARTGLKSIAGAMSHTATPINPYELVSWLLAQALAKGLHFYTHTPVESVSKTPVEMLDRQGRTDTYNVVTSRGTIKASKVIFATNAYSDGLIGDRNKKDLDARLRTHIYPVRGQVTAYKVPKSLPVVEAMLPKASQRDHMNLNWDQEYCVILPSPEDDKHVDFIYGGARRYGSGEQVGLVDDNTTSTDVSSTLDDFFTTQLGIPLETEGEEELMYNGNSVTSDIINLNSSFYNIEGSKQAIVDAAVKKSEWTGIMGFTEDSSPCVGTLNGDSSLLVIAGFGGHGMPRIFLSAKALVERYFSEETSWPEWFPEEYVN